ncbi:PASTA domain-containing protein [Nonomuraea sp. NN258]|uniref:PASTA domain-containing protein n=1 Tax=Nonomuraea antri TaxID=2730852 RepID=UPI001568B5EB|nr:PASTA domain-containing protein [Nonomuraea antri]NRQ33341.1 PASTA domain-containing protein [Nonomuraea antri]
MTYQQHPTPPPARRGLSGLAVSLIAVAALGAGCMGGAAIGSGSGSGSDAAAPQVTVTKTVRAKAAQPGGADLPEPQQNEPQQNEQAKTVTLPDFRGQNAAVAKQWLVERGWDEFEDIKLGSQDTYDTLVLLPENWSVTKQSHRAGSKVKVGTVIVLTCTKQ